MIEAGLPADEAVRQRALDPTRSFVVQAPAGSGKTELLTRRYLRLLATVDAPEQILAITFTRKAAAEMRNRVVVALARAEDPLPPEDVHRRVTWELARSARQTSERLGWELAKHPSRMRILTIDALNQSLARRLPLLSGLGAPIAIARDPDALYREALLRVVERLGEPGEDADAIACLVAHLDNNLAAFERLLLPLLARREHWLDVGLLRLEPGPLRGRLEHALQRVIEQRLAAVAALIPRELQSALGHAAAAAAAALERSGAEHAIRACRELEGLPPPTSAALPAWQGLATLLLTASGNWRRSVNVRIGFPARDKARKQAFGDLLNALSERQELAAQLDALRSLPAARYSDEQWLALDALLRVLKIAVSELDVVFSEAGAGDYPAVAIAARRALGSVDAPTDLALRLDYGLSHILVDEFQDTSRSQVELLRLLTAGWSRGDGRTLFCVGDPMQSIYRFRDAEVGLFLAIAREGLGDIDIEPLQLTVNFRSTRPLVAWSNAAFATILASGDDPGRGAVAHTRSEASPGARDEGGVVLHGFVAEADQARAAEAACVRDIARRTWEHDPAATIAILVASRTHLPRILAELRTAQLPCRAVEIEPLAGRPIVQDLLALTRALMHLGDRTAWLAVLRAPWCGLTLTELFALCADARDAAIFDLLADPDRLARLGPQGHQRVARVYPHFAASFAERGRTGVRERVERTWNALGGAACARDESELADAEVYLRRLEELDAAGQLDDVGRLEILLGDLYGSTPVGEGECAIEVMTIHKAKGLEFDVVILPALDRIVRADDEPLLRWLELPEIDGAAALLLAPIGSRGDVRDPLHQFLGNLEREKIDHERARLLYVAATRAVRELHLLGAVQPPPGRDQPLRPPARGSLLALAWPFVVAEFLARAPMADGPADPGREGPRPLQVRSLPVDFSPPAPCAPFEMRTFSEPLEDAPLRPEFDWASEATRHIGTLVHREIERLVRSGTPFCDAAQPRERRAGYVAELAELGVPPDRREGAADRVIAALTSLLQDERGRWLLAGQPLHEESDTELALSGFFGDELVNGVIDRTFVTTTGERWIVDFKTSSHEGGGLDAFLDSEVARYRVQLTRYARLMRAWDPHHPVRAALYFPLLRAWREVDV